MSLKPVDMREETGSFADACAQHTIRLPHFRTLNWAVDHVQLQDFFYPILSVSNAGPEGGAIAWDFFKSNFAKVPMHACMPSRRETLK